MFFLGLKLKWALKSSEIKQKSQQVDNANIFQSAATVGSVVLVRDRHTRDLRELHYMGLNNKKVHFFNNSTVFILTKTTKTIKPFFLFSLIFIFNTDCC